MVEGAWPPLCLSSVFTIEVIGAISKDHILHGCIKGSILLTKRMSTWFAAGKIVVNSGDRILYYVGIGGQNLL